MPVLETVVRIRREFAGGKAIRAPEGALDYRRKVEPLLRIGPFQHRLDVLLEENELLGRRDRLRMPRIHDHLVREGFEGSYDAVRRYAARWKVERRRDFGDGTTAFIPMMFQPGEAYQFDGSHEDVEIAGKPMRVKVAHMRLCASRAVYVRTYPRETQEMHASTRMRAALPSPAGCPGAVSKRWLPLADLCGKSVPRWYACRDHRRKPGLCGTLQPEYQETSIPCRP